LARATAFDPNEECGIGKRSAAAIQDYQLMVLRSGMPQAMQDEFMHRITHDIIVTASLEEQLARKFGECVAGEPPMTGR
jgi:hypothetical protein